MELDFTTCTVSAPGRADVMRRCYASFADHLRGVDLEGCVLHLNIDPMGAGIDPAIWQVADSFFANVRIHIAKSASFPAAVRWLWEQPQTERFIHLEDDWTLTRPVDIGELHAQLDADSGLSCVNLRAYSGIRDQRICLSPGLWRTSHAKAIALRLKDDEDPELQLRNGAAIGCRGRQYPQLRTAIVKDIGRAWMAEHGLKKNRHEGKRLTAWEAA